MLHRLITLLTVLILVGSVAGQLQAASSDGIEASACLVLDSASSESPDVLADGDPPEIQFNAAVGHSGGSHCLHTLTIRLDATSVAPPSSYELVRWGAFEPRVKRLSFPPSHRPPAQAS